MPTKRLFLDTSYAVALVSARDQNHARALALDAQVAADGWNIVTTRAVMLELGNAMARGRYRAKGIELLRQLDSDPKIEVVDLTRTLYESAFRLFSSRMDKEWGLIDCVSFLVMKELVLTDALTADEHFEQAGFRALLRTS